MIFCTLTTLNRIHMAMVMAKSVKEHHPHAITAVCIVEEEVPAQARSFKYFDHIVLAKDLGHPDFYRHMFKYQLRDAVWSLKPWMFQYLLRTFQGADRFIYLDTDTKVYGPFHEVNQNLNESPIVLTPHITYPSMQDELQLNKAGLYNSGFLALKRSGESLRFLTWWAERLEQFCYLDVKQGIFGDQKWLDHAPIFFQVHILKHPGYNVAQWNFYYRRMSLTNGQFRVNEQPLRFYHFSHFNNVHFWRFIQGMFPDPSHPIQLLVAQYRHELSAMGYHPSRTLPCSYDRYRSGEPIVSEARVHFRNHPKRFALIQNPFTMSNRTFLKHGQREPLRKRKRNPAGERKLVGRKRNNRGKTGNRNGRRQINRNRRKRNVRSRRQK